MGDAITEETFVVRSADGTQIGCVVDGEGPPLLMVHGTGDTHLGWRRIRPLLRRHFKLYMMDRRGRGVSADRDDYALEREWDDVAAVIDAIDGVNLFGHSFGAMCALEGVLRARRGTLRRLAVYEPSVNRMAPNAARDGAVDEMGRLIARGDRDAVVETHLRHIIRASDETIAKQRAMPDTWAARRAMAHTMPRELLALRRYRFEPARFSAIAVPTQILYGETSAPHARQISEELHGAIAGSRLVMLEGQGHFGMLMAPELVAGMLTAFFGGA